MKVYRPVLVALTLLVSLLMSSALLSSWTEPQVQSQLNLYQSDLLLHASEWEALGTQIQGETSLRRSFLGENPIKDAITNYQTVRNSAQQDLDRLSKGALNQNALNTDAAPLLAPANPLEGPAPLQRSPQDTRAQLIDALDLRLGVLYARAGEQDKALTTWTQLAHAPKSNRSTQQIVPTAQVLMGLWSDPPRLLPEANSILDTNLKGWFRFQSLSKLYSLQQRPEAVQDLAIVEQKTARSSFLRLLMVGAMPILGSVVGVSILLVWGIRALLKQRGKPLKPAIGASVPASSALSSSLLPLSLEVTEQSADQVLPGTVVWPKETIWQVMVLWFAAFFGVSYIFVPVTVALLGLKPAALDGRLQAYLALFSYGCLMVAGLGILQISLRPYLPNVLRWLRLRWSGNWLGWGLGGYFVALPLVLIISLLNQKLLKDQGGGNPILEIILQGHDKFTIALLWFLVAVCAPLFEEALFRGFFLTSLTRYIPIWQAVALSGIVFAVAHLNVGDLLPLCLLGMVLGVVYLRSRNLLASMLLHSLWNSGSFVGLLILGSSGT